MMGGRGSVVSAYVGPNSNPKNPGFDPLAGQGERQGFFLSLRVNCTLVQIRLYLTGGPPFCVYGTHPNVVRAR